MNKKKTNSDSPSTSLNTTINWCPARHRDNATNQDGTLITRLTSTFSLRSRTFYKITYFVLNFR